jgi:hypothetical protein
MIKKICKKCKTEYNYEKEEDISKDFYKKSGYYLNTCKKCECGKHADKYSSGKYDYNKDRDFGYFEGFSIGNHNRCNYFTSDEYPFFNRKRKIR